MKLSAPLVSLAACFFLAACAAPVRGLFPPHPGQKTETFYLLEHGWHDGLIVKSDTLPRAARPDWTAPPWRGRQFKYLEVGWGDAGFYNAKKITPGITLKALFWKNPAVLHVVAMDQPPEIYFRDSGLVRVTVSEEGYRRLCDYLAAAYKTDAGGHRIDLGPGLYGESRFYAATGFYYSFNTCNVWTARALRATGVPVSPACSIFARPLFNQATHFGVLVRKP
jgi:uncharacterized protein (TIGR02117 family)